MKKILFFLLLVINLIFFNSNFVFSKVVEDKIILGATISLTGKYSSNGVHTQNGYNLAVNKINSMGGVKVGGKTYKFEIIYYDDESNSRRAAQLTERLIKKDKVQFMLGPYSSGLTNAIAPLTEKYQIPMVEANGASRALFTKGYKYLFAVLSTSTQYLEIAVDLAVEKNEGKPVKIAMAFEQDAFSQDVRLGVIEAAKRTKSKIIIDDKLPRELNDMAATLAKVKAVKPDLLIVSGHTKGALTAVRQISDMNIDVPMLAMTHCDAYKLSKYVGKNAEHTLCVSQWHKDLSYSDNIFTNGIRYDEDFTTTFGYPPPYQAAESSAALLVYKDAFERANSFDKDKVRNALAVTDIETFYGNIKFDSTGKNIAKPMAVLQIECDNITCVNKLVAPTKWASAKLIHPIPKWKDSHERYATTKELIVTPKKIIKVAKVEESTSEEFVPKKTNQDNEAPIIQIAEVITVNNASYEVEGTVTDKTKIIYIEVDGRPIKVKKGKFTVKGYSPIDKQITIEAIDQWGNRSQPKIVSIIIDRKNTIVADTFEALDPSKIISKSNKNRIALIIGIEKYKQTPEATFANLDAQYFYEYARKGFGLSQSNIKLLVDENANLVESLGILNKWLPGKIKSGETELIIFFAGHGLASNDGKELYLLPQDGDPDLLRRTALSRTELFKEIISLNPKSVTIFLDTCYSGVSRDEKTLLASARPVRIVVGKQDTPDNFTIFSASQLDQISSGFKEVKQGIFSYYLMKGLEGKADANKDKNITNGELLAYMDQNVAQKAAELGRQQNPDLIGDPDKILMSYE